MSPDQKPSPPKPQGPEKPALAKAPPPAKPKLAPAPPAAVGEPGLAPPPPVAKPAWADGYEPTRKAIRDQGVSDESLPIDELEIALDENEAEAEAQEADERIAKERDELGLEPDNGVSQIQSLRQLQTGARFGGYEIIKEIGHGAMSRVFAAKQMSMERIVALKCLDPSLAQTSQVQQFVQEAKSAGKLIHENIVQTFDVGFERGVYYIAMEYIRGRNLQRILSQTRMFGPKLAIQTIRTIARALDSAHRRGLVHRDVKLDNVMFTADKVLKLMDFGLVQDKSVEEQRAGHVAGSPNYISPEQARGETTDFHTDVYSLGVCFYYMLTGRFPHIGVTTRHLIEAHLTKQPRPPVEINPRVPDVANRLVLRMLRKKPTDRFDSYAALLDALDEALEDDAVAGVIPVVEIRHMSSALKGGIGRKQEILSAASAEGGGHAYEDARTVAPKLDPQHRGQELQSSEAAMGYRPVVSQPPPPLAAPPPPPPATSPAAAMQAPLQTQPAPPPVQPAPPAIEPVPPAIQPAPPAIEPAPPAIQPAPPAIESAPPAADPPQPPVESAQPAKQAQPTAPPEAGAPAVAAAPNGQTGRRPARGAAPGTKKRPLKPPSEAPGQKGAPTKGTKKKTLGSLKRRDGARGRGKPPRG